MIFGHIFCKDPIDIHEQIYGTLNLSMYRSYPQSDFSVTFFSKELSHKINCPVRDEIFRVFSRKNQFSYIFLIYLGLKSCFSYNLIICEHDAWHYLIKFWKKYFTKFSCLKYRRIALQRSNPLDHCAPLYYIGKWKWLQVKRLFNSAKKALRKWEQMFR